MRSGFPVRPVAVLVQPHADLPIAVVRKTHVLEGDAVTFGVHVAVEDIDAGCRNRQGHPDQWAEAPHAVTLEKVKPRMTERIRIVRKDCRIARMDLDVEIEVRWSRTSSILRRQEHDVVGQVEPPETVGRVREMDVPVPEAKVIAITDT